VSGIVLQDRRPAAARRLLALWRKWDAGTDWAVRAGERLTAHLASAYLRRRIAARGQPPASPWIVSVGSLTVGGSGKTPIVLDLAAALARRGWRGAIVSRGYGSRVRGPIAVGSSDPLAQDEARLLAAKVPSWRVWQARRRAAGVATALAAPEAPDCVILEDGHQTAGVARHLDVLILDRWRFEDGRVMPLFGRVLPWGPYREKEAGADRADVWLVEWNDPAPPPPLTPCGSRSIPIIPFRRAPVPPSSSPEALVGPYAVVSGLARPERFERDCRRLLERDPALAVRYADHAVYSTDHVRRLQVEGSRLGVRFWLTTEKDWIKLARLWSGDIPAFALGLRIDWPGSETLPDWVGERFQEVRS
jgi:tetraacyldisaccharide 4'-kinase